MYLQTPLSRVEPDQLLNDRYAAMEERLAVSFKQVYCMPNSLIEQVTDQDLLVMQIVRKRLNKPMTYAEKVIAFDLAKVGSR